MATVTRMPAFHHGMQETYDEDTIKVRVVYEVSAHYSSGGEIFSHSIPVGSIVDLIGTKIRTGEDYERHGNFVVIDGKSYSIHPPTSLEVVED